MLQLMVLMTVMAQCAVPSPSGNLEASCNESGKVTIWRVGRHHHRQVKRVETTFQIGGPVTSWAWSPDSQILAMVGDFNGVKVWERRTSRLRLFCGEDDVVEVSFGPTNATLATLTRQGQHRLWDFPNQRSLGLIR